MKVVKSLSDERATTLTPRPQDRAVMTEITFSYRGESLCLVAPDEHDVLPAWVRRFGTFYECDVLERCESYIRRLGRAGETIIDVGACIGNHTVFYAIFCQPDRVIAFEPSQSSFDALIRTIHRNRLSNVAAYRSAVGARHGRGSVVMSDPTNRGATRVQPGADAAADGVPITPLDAVLESRDSIRKGISLLKIDVEGMECEVLEGAARTIARFEPILCIEILDRAHMRRVIETLKRSSYLIRECNGAAPTYLLTWERRIPRVLIRVINYGWSLLARYGNAGMGWWYRRAIEIALPV